MSSYKDEFNRIAGVAPLYKDRVHPEVDRAKAREAARIELEYNRRDKAHKSTLDDRMKVLAGLKRPSMAGAQEVEESTKAGRYELVVRGKLVNTYHQPKKAMAKALKSRGDVQVVDSKTGSILYDSLAKKKK